MTDVTTDEVGYVGESAASWYRALVSPRRVAVVGASANPEKGGLLRNLLRLGFQGDAVAINPKGGIIDGLTAVTDIRDVDAPVDLALVAVPARHVPDAIRGCADAGVQVAYIVSSGFAELGERGAELQAQAVREASRGRVRLLGPNSNGIISARSGLAGSIMTPVGDLTAPLTCSGVAVISQSGAIGAFIFTGCLAAGLPVGTYTSTGNEADVGFEELLGALVDDLSVQVILAYVEGLRDGPRFIAAARRAQQLGKPIVLLKVGVTDEGAKASASHTASMAGRDVVYDGVLRQLGVRRAATLRELIDAGRLLAAVPAGVGPRVGVVTISGGLAVMATDEIVGRSLQLPAWNTDSVARFGELLPDYVGVHNPLDTSGVMADDVMLLRAVLETASADDQTDVILLCLGGSRTREQAVLSALREVVPTLAKPVLVVWVGASNEFPAVMHESGIACFDSIEAALAAVSLALSVPSHAEQDDSALPDEAGRRRALDEAVALITQARAAGRTTLDEVESKAILRAFNVPAVGRTGTARRRRISAAVRADLPGGRQTAQPRTSAQIRRRRCPARVGRPGRSPGRDLPSSRLGRTARTGPGGHRGAGAGQHRRRAHSGGQRRSHVWPGADRRNRWCSRRGRARHPDSVAHPDPIRGPRRRWPAAQPKAARRLPRRGPGVTAGSRRRRRPLRRHGARAGAVGL